MKRSEPKLSDRTFCSACNLLSIYDGRLTRLNCSSKSRIVVLGEGGGGTTGERKDFGEREMGRVENRKANCEEWRCYKRGV